MSIEVYRGAGGVLNRGRPYHGGPRVQSTDGGHQNWYMVPIPEPFSRRAEARIRRNDLPEDMLTIPFDQRAPGVNRPIAPTDVGEKLGLAEDEHVAAVMTIDDRFKAAYPADSWTDMSRLMHGLEWYLAPLKNRLALHALKLSEEDYALAHNTRLTRQLKLAQSAWHSVDIQL